MCFSLYTFRIVRLAIFLNTNVFLINRNSPKTKNVTIQPISSQVKTFLQCSEFCKFSQFVVLLEQWFPTGGSRPQSGSRRSFCGVANSSLNTLLKFRIFRSLYINILLHQQNRNTDRSLRSPHYLHHNSYLISPIQFKST